MNDRAQAGPIRRYGIAVVAVAITIGVKLLLEGLGADHPFVLLPAAVVVAAWYGGTGPGVLATLLVAAASVYFLAPPDGPGADASDFVGIGGLLAEGALVVALTVGLRSARLRAETARAASAAAHRETTFALAIRDEMLGCGPSSSGGPWQTWSRRPARRSMTSRPRATSGRRNRSCESSWTKRPWSDA